MVLVVTESQDARRCCPEVTSPGTRRSGSRSTIIVRSEHEFTDVLVSLQISACLARIFSSASNDSNESNWCIWIREKTLEFSSPVLPAPSPYRMNALKATGLQCFHTVLQVVLEKESYNGCGDNNDSNVKLAATLRWFTAGGAIRIAV